MISGHFLYFYLGRTLIWWSCVPNRSIKSDAWPLFILLFGSELEQKVTKRPQNVSPVIGIHSTGSQPEPVSATARRTPLLTRMSPGWRELAQGKNSLKLYSIVLYHIRSYYIIFDYIQFNSVEFNSTNSNVHRPASHPASRFAAGQPGGQLDSEH